MEEFVIDDRLHGRIGGGRVCAVVAVHDVRRSAGRRGGVHVGGWHLIRVHRGATVILVRIAVVVTLPLVRDGTVSAAPLHLVVVVVVSGSIRHAVVFVGIMIGSVVRSLEENLKNHVETRNNAAQTTTLRTNTGGTVLQRDPDFLYHHPIFIFFLHFRLHPAIAQKYSA